MLVLILNRIFVRRVITVDEVLRRYIGMMDNMQNQGLNQFHQIITDSHITYASDQNSPLYKMEFKRFDFRY